jgi:hypothetical protein
MTVRRFPGQVPAPGFLIVCVKCGYIAEYDCNCDGPFDSRDWSDALHFNTADDAKNAATRAPKIGVEPCSCGHRSCTDFWLTGVGKFVQGSGFTKEEAERIAALLNWANGDA